jgi:hypothetical protein
LIRQQDCKTIPERWAPAEYLGKDSLFAEDRLAMKAHFVNFTQNLIKGFRLLPFVICHTKETNEMSNARIQLLV